ncbi:hypothetical protein QNO07_13040 [Streptomyces sp. 549]|uniref:hypothetical protein n=1 Tax=Streptomyces sp. 549 TaxID=3049076 RepID=UPI0024C26DEA|nr:hypothetical protein [Streptomyces sp. 549]MDK1474336.1 hypothetical protein [Streptomyces sp. 549]
MDAHLRTTLAAAGAALALLSGGCAGGQQHDGPGTAAATGPHPADLDEDRLRLALLDLGDLPPGWVPDTEGAAEDRGIGVPQPDDGPCRTLFQDPAETAADTRFARSPVGPFVTTRTGAHGSADGAEEALSAFERAAEQCSRFQVTEGTGVDSGTVAYEARRLRLPELGDDSAALRFVRRGPGDDRLTVVADVVYARVGAGTVHLAQAGPEEVDGEGVEPLARRAVEKLGEVTAEQEPDHEQVEPDGVPDVTQLRAAAYARPHE